MIFLPKHTAQLADLAGGPDCRFSLQGVHVLEYEGGQYRVEASDGHYVGIVTGETENEAAPGRLNNATEKLSEAANGCYDYIIKREAWNAGFKLCKNPATRQFEPLGLVASVEEVTMAVSDCTAKSEPLAGRFPNVDGVLPKAPPTISVRIDPKLLIGLLRTATAFADPNNGGVMLHFWDNMMGVSTRNQSQTFDGLLVGLGEVKEEPKAAVTKEGGAS